MRKILAYLAGGIAGMIGMYFGGWMGLCAVLIGQLSIIIHYKS